MYDPVSWVVSLGHWDALRKSVLAYQLGKRTLEIGFGTGELLLEMHRRGIWAVGLDRSPAMQRQTRKKMRRLGMWCPRVQAGSLRMPFAGQSFDTIYATFPADYIFEADTWREVGRLLNRPGRFVVVGIGTSNAQKPASPLSRLIFGPPMEPLSERLQKLAGEAGLDLRWVFQHQGNLTIPLLIAEA